MAFLQRLTAAVVFMTVVAAGCAASPAIDDPSAAPDAVVSPMPSGSVSKLRAPATTALPPVPLGRDLRSCLPGRRRSGLCEVEG